MSSGEFTRWDSAGLESRRHAPLPTPNADLFAGTTGPLLPAPRPPRVSHGRVLDTSPKRSGQSGTVSGMLSAPEPGPGDLATPGRQGSTPTSAPGHCLCKAAPRVCGEEECLRPWWSPGLRGWPEACAPAPAADVTTGQRNGGSRAAAH